MDADQARAARPASTKVPEVTLVFWITKVLSTGMGETTSDFLVRWIAPEVAVVIGGFALAGALALALRADRYRPWTYWLAVVMVAIFGTMAADVLHVELAVPYVASTAFFVVVLVAVFACWQASERTLSVHSIYTRRRELFYWAAVLTTFALGTAAGDWTAITLHLGYFSSGLLFAVLIALPTVGWWRFQLNPIVAFWCAYILTRPLGASFADWLGAPVKHGGLGLGYGPVSLALAVVIVGFVAYIAATGHEARIDER